MRKPRQYGHKPIYYDPRKEQLEERIQKVKMDMGIEEKDYDKYRESIRGSFVEGTAHLKKSVGKGDDVRVRTNKSMRLVIIMVALGIAYWYFFLR